MAPRLDKIGIFSLIERIVEHTFGGGVVGLAERTNHSLLV